MTYENVLKYREYFMKPNQDFVKWEKQNSSQDGVMVMPFPEYDQELRDFIKEVEKTDLMHTDYMSILEDNDFDVDHINEILESSDFELTRAILTFLIRQERFGEGAWGEAAKDGYFLKILKRLKELQDD